MIIAIFLLLMGGCATYHSDNLDRMQTLPQHYDQFDLKLAWGVKPVEDSTVIDGVVKNIRYWAIENEKPTRFIQAGY